MLKRILFLKQIPLCPDFGLLSLRVILYLPLFIKHGTEKLFTFGQMSQHFPDPLGIGVIPSLLFAALADGICTLLLILGLFTRWASFILFVNVFVAWAFVHHFQLFGKGADHGELIVLYLGGCVALFFCGAGKYSLDRLLDRSE
jgi:putative oxidoreductase